MQNPIRLDIAARRPFAGGHLFGNTGAYERIDARAHFEVDPHGPDAALVVDLAHAERNANGLVACAADVCLLRPVDASLGNRRMLFGYGNRGNKRELQFFNDAPPSNDPLTRADAGNGFLMRRGYTVVWCAWEGDLLHGDGRLVLDVPVAYADGAPIVGPVRSEFVIEQPGVRCLPLSGRASTRPYPAASTDTSQARLTRRRYATDTRIEIPSTEWSYARVESGAGLDAQGAEQALVASDTHIYVNAGFEPGWIYELVYPGRDPRVHGLGHLVVRDLVSFLRHEHTDAAGAPNPLGADTVDRAYAWGRSQTGRCIRDFVHLGFNADPAGRRVFDGVMPHVSGGGLMWMNHRFSQVVSPAGQQYEDHYNAADRFPFSYASCTDHHSGRTDAILKRPETDPLVIHTQTATEYWQRRGSLVHTDTRGIDLDQPESVRVYLWSSSQHFADPNLAAPKRGVCQHYVNVVSTSMLFRAMLDALDTWASGGEAPPPSRVPRRDDGTLVEHGVWRDAFPAVPGVAVPRAVNTLPRLDFGERFDAGVLDREPPAVLDEDAYPTLVPAVDADGNDLAGVRAPMVAAPLGTYTGWNLRARGHGTGAMHEFTGAYIPFPDTPEERAATGDPRPSVLERYGDPAAYADAIERAARALVAERLMLEEDVARAREAARDWGRPRHDVRL